MRIMQVAAPEMKTSKAEDVDTQIQRLNNIFHYVTTMTKTKAGDVLLFI